jgi:hypothetical protein
MADFLKVLRQETQIVTEIATLLAAITDDAIADVVLPEVELAMGAR